MKKLSELSRPLILLLACVILAASMMWCTNTLNESIRYHAQLTGNGGIHIDQSSANEELMIAAEVGDLIGCSRQEVIDMVENGQLKGTYLKLPNGNYVFVREKLVEWFVNQAEDSAL